MTASKPIEPENPNIMLESEIEEFGLEEADDSLGPSWDEVEALAAARGKANGKKQDSGIND